jgi:Holliday junction resolvase RusA-like endonuclease
MLRYFFIPGQPQGKLRARTFYHKQAKRIVSMTPEKTENYESLIRYAYSDKYRNEPLIDSETRIIIRAVFPVPASTSKKMRGLMLAGEIAPTKKPDADNIMKVVCDALNGIAYTDDARIVTVLLEKEYGEIPGVYVLLDDDWKSFNMDDMMQKTDAVPF